MAAHLVGRLVCSFRGHRWRVELNRATQGTEADCSRCGAHKSTYPGDPNLGKRQPGADGTVTWGGGVSRASEGGFYDAN